MIVNKHFMCALGSTIKSWLTPVDSDYIIRQREWLSDTGVVVRFDDSSATIRGDTIFIDSKPAYKVHRLNKFLNEFVATSHSGKKVTFISTEELI
jgi:hypothetical protein